MNNINLRSGERIVTPDGTPTLAFLAKWQDMLGRLEAVEQVIAGLPDAYVAKDAGTTDWTAATGTATRTTFATGSVTTAELAERVKALLDDLITNGAVK